MATHPRILAWRIPWTEEPGELQSRGLQSQTRLKRLSTCTESPHSQFSHILRGWSFSLQVWAAALQHVSLGTYSAFNLLGSGFPLGSCVLCEHAQPPVCRAPAPPGAVSYSSLPVPMPYSSIRSQFGDRPSLAPSLGLPLGPPSHTHSVCYYCHRRPGRRSVPSLQLCTRY